MPAGPAVSAIGPWVADASRPTCVECHKQFGLFTRRHHCRRCGEIFCAKCSKYASRHIAGLESFDGVSLRVCKCCFLRHLAFMVVARKTFGVKFELFGSQTDAAAYYRKCSSSRLLVAMSSGQTVEFFYESETIRQRLLHKAQGARNFLLGGHQVAAALHQDPLDHSRVSYMGDMSNRSVAGAWCMVFTAEYGGEWHYAMTEIRGAAERQRALDAFGEYVKKEKQVTKAVVMNLRGLTVLFAHASHTLSRTSAVVASAQNFVRHLPCLSIIHVGGECTARLHSALSTGLETMDQLPSECSAILFNPRFDSIARHRCEIATFREELCNYGGVALLQQLHKNCRVAVVTPRDVITVTDSFSTALGAAESTRQTQGDETIAIVALHPQDEAAAIESSRVSGSDESVGGRPPPSAESAALRLKTLRVCGVSAASSARPPSLPEARLVQAARTLQDACRSASEGAAGDGDGAAQASMKHQHSTSNATTPGRNMPEVASCSICMEDYGLEVRRPTMCASCGNTICLECWRETRVCPMCRCDKPQRPITNIALLQLLESAQESL